MGPPSQCRVLCNTEISVVSMHLAVALRQGWGDSHLKKLLPLRPSGAERVGERRGAATCRSGRESRRPACGADGSSLGELGNAVTALSASEERRARESWGGPGS